MKIPVDIRLKTESLPITGPVDMPAETTEVNLKGELRKVDNGFVLRYKSNMTDNTIAVFDNLVTLNRSGDINSQLVFEEGRSYFGTFSDSQSTVQMTTVTRKLENKLTEQGGCVLIDYSISYGGSLYERNRVTYSIVPGNDNIAS